MSITNLYPSSYATQDIDDLYLDLVIIEQTDMAIASRKRIVMKYTKQKSESVRGQSFAYEWLTKEIGKNASGETIYIKTTDRSNSRPNWLPPEGSLEDTVFP